MHACHRPGSTRWLIRVSAAAALAAAATAACATENGASHYPLGIDTNFSGVILPDGPHFFANYSHYVADRLKGNDGQNNPAAVNYRSQVDTVGVRFSYVWPGVRVLGARVETRVIQVVPTLDLELGLRRPAPLPPLDRGGQLTGLSDLYVMPAFLGWQSGAFHQAAGVDFYFKTGSYDVNRNVNIGRNYNEVGLSYAVTWFPQPAWSVNAKLRYAFNGTNKATDYESGNEAMLEFNTMYRVAQAWSAGLSGYVYRQTTDDVRAGVVVNGNGNRGRVNAIGPALTYNFSRDAAINFKWQHEFDARNRPQGNKFWIMGKIPL